MRKFTFFIPVLMAALLAAGQSWAAEVGTAQYFLEQGKEHFKGGNLDQAITDYTKALELNPKSGLAHVKRASAKSHKNDLDGAIARYKGLGYGVVQSGAWGDVGKKGSGRYGYMATDAIGGVTVELTHAYN